MGVSAKNMICANKESIAMFANGWDCPVDVHNKDG